MLTSYSKRDCKTIPAGSIVSVLTGSLNSRVKIPSLGSNSTNSDNWGQLYQDQI